MRISGKKTGQLSCVQILHKKLSNTNISQQQNILQLSKVYLIQNL